LTKVSGKKSDPDSLRPAAYQLVPLAKLLAGSLGGVLIADGVGVGKTISAGYVLSYSRAKYDKPGIVVCVPGLVSKWLLELRSKFGLQANPIRSLEDLDTAKIETLHRTSSIQPVYVMTNSLLTKAKQESYPNLGVVILDEIHTYRNNETKWYKGSRELCLKSDLRVGLSATPINNALSDLVAELSLLLPDYDLDAVAAMVNDMWNSNRKALTDALITRFLKDRLGIHFVHRTIRSIPIKFPETYAQFVTKEIRNKTGEGSFLEQITYFRLASSSPQAFYHSVGKEFPKEMKDPKYEVLSKVLEEKNVSHWLVFCEFTETVNFLCEHLGRFVVYVMTGDTPMFERESLIKSFQKSPRAVLILTSVGSEGLDLQFCEGLVNYDLHWNPMKLEQRAGRIDRLGQEKKSVQIVNIHVVNSIDDRVIAVMRRKLDIVSNSVFSTGALLSREKTSGNGSQMFDEKTLAHELTTGESLFETFRINSSLESRDYEMLQFVDLSFCNPRRMEEGAKELEPRSLVHDSDWITRVSKQSNSIRELLKFYS
jgi:SNF2 family DNA or RNA helicase